MFGYIKKNIAYYLICFVLWITVGVSFVFFYKKDSNDFYSIISFLVCFVIVNIARLLYYKYNNYACFLFYIFSGVGCLGSLILYRIIPKIFYKDFLSIVCVLLVAVWVLPLIYHHITIFRIKSISKDVLKVLKKNYVEKTFESDFNVTVYKEVAQLLYSKYNSTLYLYNLSNKQSNAYYSIYEKSKDTSFLEKDLFDLIDSGNAFPKDFDQLKYFALICISVRDIDYYSFQTIQYALERMDTYGSFYKIINLINSSHAFAQEEKYGNLITKKNEYVFVSTYFLSKYNSGVTPEYYKNHIKVLYPETISPISNYHDYVDVLFDIDNRCDICFFDKE